MFFLLFFHFHLLFTKASQTAEFFMKQIISQDNGIQIYPSICLLAMTTLIIIPLTEYYKNYFFCFYSIKNAHVHKVTTLSLYRGTCTYTLAKSEKCTEKLSSCLQGSSKNSSSLFCKDGFEIQVSFITQ